MLNLAVRKVTARQTLYKMYPISVVYCCRWNTRTEGQTDTTSLCVNFIPFAKTTHDTRNSFTIWQTCQTPRCSAFKEPINLCSQRMKAKYCSLLVHHVCPDFQSVAVSCVTSVSEEFTASLFRFEMIIKPAHVVSCTLRSWIWRQLVAPKDKHIHLPNWTKFRAQDQREQWTHCEDLKTVICFSFCKFCLRIVGVSKGNSCSFLLGDVVFRLPLAATLPSKSWGQALTSPC
jgi:hypothetical protein